MAHTLAVTGASGFIGKGLLQRPELANFEKVRLLVHDRAPPISQLGSKVTIVRGDLLRQDTIGALLTPDATVIHLAYLPGQNQAENLVVTRNLAHACARAGIKRFVHCSTTDVYGDIPDEVVTEQTPCRPRTSYERTKYAIEMELTAIAENHFELVVLRPAAVFGPGGRNLLALARRLASRSTAANFFALSLHHTRRMNLAGVGNVAAALLFLASVRTHGCPDLYILSDDEDQLNNYAAVERAMREYLGIPACQIPALSALRWLLPLALRLKGRSNTNPRRVYAWDRLRAAGFVKPCSLRDELAAFMDWYAMNATSSVR
jgi:nucleoside-diphosphate-sugar epimerase